MIFRKRFKELQDLMSKDYNPVNGYCEFDDRIEVYVQSKLPLNEIAAQVIDSESPWGLEDIVPDTCEGKPTDVIEIGEVVAQADGARYRPITGGVQMQPSGANFVGTLGVVGHAAKFGGFTLVGGLRSFKTMLDRMGISYEKVPVAITNAHVTQLDILNHTQNRAVSQPNGSNWFGQVLWSSHIKRHGRNELDASVCSVDQPVLINQVIDVGEVNGAREPVIGEQVHKRGRTTYYTEGSCRARGARVNIRFGDVIIPFENCHLFSNMSTSGDSGSIIVGKEDNKAVSLLFAGSPTTTIGCSITRTLEESGVWLGD
jgi:hypothetical protein